MDPESKALDRAGSPASSDSDSDSDTSDQNEAPVQQSIEWLATAREKRSTAGNRMKSMLANEEPDSDLELLFAEDDDDQGFTDVGDNASDVHMDSSSDDEDENAPDDDMEGEKELERQAREKRNAQRKRKAQEAIPAKFRKKVRISTTTKTTPSPAPSSTSAPGPRPKKKSERASWLPLASDMPTRASSRQTTRLSKEQLHAQMEEREARRLKQLAQMQKKAAKLEALKKPPMTQEERLREAEIVEKRNSKSLNRWEVAEKQREEERKAKLAALNERTLKGPVITFWSGTREWQDGGAARYVVMEEKPKRKPREKKDKTQGKPGSTDKNEEKGQDGQSGEKGIDKDSAPGDAKKVDTAQVDAPADPTAESISKEKAASATKPQPAATVSPEQGLGKETDNTPTRATGTPQAPNDVSASQSPVATTLDSNAAVPASGSALSVPQSPKTTSSLPRESSPGKASSAPVLALPAGMDPVQAPPGDSTAQQSKSQVLAPPNAPQAPQPPSNSALTSGGSNKTAPNDTKEGERAADHNSDEGKFLKHSMVKKESTGKAVGVPAQDDAVESPAGDKTPSEQPPEKKQGATYTRSAIVYQNFDEVALRDKSIQVQVLFGRKMNKLAKPPPHPLCVITNHPARYRDPQTGLPFYNAQAYREIRRLERGEYRWSRLLGTWISGKASAATGVPERFLNPDAPSRKKDAEAAQKDGVTAKEQEKAEDKGSAAQESTLASADKPEQGVSEAAASSTDSKTQDKQPETAGNPTEIKT